MSTIFLKLVLVMSLIAPCSAQPLMVSNCKLLEKRETHQPDHQYKEFYTVGAKDRFALPGRFLQ